MTEKHLLALEALVQVATPGPWQACPAPPKSFSDHGLRLVVRTLHDAAPNVYVDKSLVWQDGKGIQINSEADAAFIAAARQGVPELIAEVRRLRSRIKRYIKTID